MIVHPIPPVYNPESEILILGSFPSVKSRETGFFYGHPQNRFWRVMAGVCGCAVPQSVEEKKQMLLTHHIAVWDVIRSCEIVGSSDSSIRNAEPNDIGMILSAAPIRAVFVNGKKAESLYRKYLEPATGRSAVTLPSTSPANAAWSEQKLLVSWKQAISDALAK